MISQQFAPAPDLAALRAGRLIAILCLAAAACVQAQSVGAPAGLTADQVLAQSRARYAALKTYADTGTVVTEYRIGKEPISVERHTFTTYYQAPRQFYLEFRKDPNVGDERFVIWGDGADFHTWWSATQVHDTYPPGSGSNAFALGSEPTKGAAVMAPALLFAKAGLHGPLVDFTLSAGTGMETLAGHRCYRLLGQEAPTYGTGTVAGARAVTLWIEAESLLVRRVLEDTPRDSGADSILRVTTSFEPQADPAIGAAKFRFAVPDASR